MSILANELQRLADPAGAIRRCWHRSRVSIPVQRASEARVHADADRIKLVLMLGVEPRSAAYKAAALPLCYISVGATGRCRSGTYSVTARRAEPLHHSRHQLGEALRSRTGLCEVAARHLSRLVRASVWHGTKELNPVLLGWSQPCCRNTCPANGSSHRTRTCNVEINNLAPVPVWTVRNGAATVNRTPIIGLEARGSSQTTTAANWCRVSESNRLQRFFKPPL